MKTSLFSSTVGDIQANMAFINNPDAVTDPGATSDSSLGYTSGSVWTNKAGQRAWTCVDATVGAAVWIQSGQVGGDLLAPNASTPTGTGGAALVRGGTGGTTSGAGGTASTTGGAATNGNSDGGAAAQTGGAGHGSGNGGASNVVGGAAGATGTGGAAKVTGGVGGATSGAGGAAQVTGGAGTLNANGGEADLTGGAGQGTGSGAAAKVTGGASGAGATGNGGAAAVTGGAAVSTNGNGGSVVHTPGVGNGSGVSGGIRNEGLICRLQGAPAAKTVSATLTGAEVIGGIVTVLQGGAGASALQLPAGASIDAVLPADFAVNDSFDMSLINLSVVDAEDATLTTNTNLTLIGSMDFPAHSAVNIQSQGIVRFRKTATATYTVYRIA